MMVFWTDRGLLDKQMKANTVAAAAVVRRPDKTLLQVLNRKNKTAHSVFPLFLCLQIVPRVCIYLVMTLPGFCAVNMSTLQSGPQPNGVAEPLCLR